MAAAVTRAERLQAYLRSEAARPFRWGQADCATFVADWVRAETGRDPLSALRGRYHGPHGSARICRRLGFNDRLALMRSAMTAFPPVPAPAIGDIGLLDVHGMAVLALRTATGWASRGPRGVTLGIGTILQTCGL